MSLENNLEFFQEGLKSYMSAMLALKQFRLDVQRKSKKVLEGNLEELEQALGTPLEAATIQAYVYPAEPSEKFNGTFTWLTSRLPNAARLHSGYPALFGLRWHEIDGEAEPGVAAGFWFNSARDRDAAKQAFGKGGDSLIGPDENGWYFWEPLKDAKYFEGKLDELIKRWIELWRQVGGLNGSWAAKR